MQNENKAGIASFFNVDVLASLAVNIGILIYFYQRISGFFAGVDLNAETPRYSYFMLAMTCIALLVLFIRSITHGKGTSFMWLPFFYAVFGFISTALSGMYLFKNLPFRFVELFYWVAAMSLAYYAVQSLKSIKLHVAMIVFAIPFLAYGFIRMRGKELGFTDVLWLNPIFFIAFLTPVVLLLKNKFLKFGFLFLIFVLIVFSYKRMALIAFSMSLLVYFYFLLRSGTPGNMSKYIAVFLGAVMFAGILAFTFKYMASSFGLDWGERMSNIVSGGGGGRIDIWKTILGRIAAHPKYWLMGQGKGALMLEKYWAHNDFIEILYDFGIIGFLFYVAFAVKSIQIFFQMKKYRYRNLGAFGASLVWAFWGGMTDVFVNYPYWFLGLAMFWGIVIGDFENFKNQALADESSDICQYEDADAADAPYA
jgi:hypothetical protein